MQQLTAVMQAALGALARRRVVEAEEAEAAVEEAEAEKCCSEKASK